VIRLSIESKERIDTMANDELQKEVQMSVKITADLRNQVKIMAIMKGERINDTLARYIAEGVAHDKEK